VKLLSPFRAMSIMWGSCMPVPVYHGEVIECGAIFGASFEWVKYYPLVREVQIRFRRPGLTDVILETGLERGAGSTNSDGAEEKEKPTFTLDLENSIDAMKSRFVIVQESGRDAKMTPEVCAFLSKISRNKANLMEFIKLFEPITIPSSPN